MSLEVLENLTIDQQIEKLNQEIKEQTIICSEFESALQDLSAPPKYPNPTPSQPMQALERMIQDRRDEADRGQVLAEARLALEVGRQHLRELIERRDRLSLEFEAQMALPEVEALGHQMIAKLAEVEAIWAQLQDLNRSHGKAIRDVTGHAAVESKSDSYYEQFNLKLPKVTVSQSGHVSSQTYDQWQEMRRYSR